MAAEGSGVKSSISLTQIGATSGEPFPIIDKVWDIYAKKGIRTVFVTIGNSKSSAADLDLAESLGCPIHAVPLTATETDAWAEVTQILKDRKRDSEAAKHSFSAGAETKWILPKNVRPQASLPWWTAGSITLADGSTVATTPLEPWLGSICGALKMKELELRIDILKIDTTQSAPGLEKAILPALLSAGTRPGLILVNWAASPDSDLSSTLAAGHLQTCGYHLVSKIDNKFLYYFVDNNLYEICSWEDTRAQNPMMQTLINEAGRAVRASYIPTLAVAAPAPTVQKSAPETETAGAP